MSTFLTGVAVLVLAAFFVDAVVRSRRRALRQSGLLPPAGQGTEADVARLLREGYRIEAVKLYREIHGGGLKEAKEAVDTLAAAPWCGEGRRPAGGWRTLSTRR